MSTDDDVPTPPDGQNYEECFTPRRFLRRSPVMIRNRSINKENEPIPSAPQEGAGQKRRSRLSFGSSTLGKRTRSQLKLADSTTSGALVAPEDSSGSREASGSSLKVDECSALVFTPRKCLHRTPPNSRPGAIAEEKKAGQDSCYTPSKTLQCTLPRGGRGSDKRDGERPGGMKGIKRPRSNSPSASQSETGTGVDLPASNKALKRSLSVRDCDSEGAKRGVQASCFSPKKTLRRSLPSTAVPGFEGDLAVAVPPSSEWEIARTPVSQSKGGPFPATAAYDQPPSSLAKQSKNQQDNSLAAPLPPKAKATTQTSSSHRNKNRSVSVTKKNNSASTRRTRSSRSGDGIDDIPPTAKWEIPRTPPTGRRKISSVAQEALPKPSLSLESNATVTAQNKQDEVEKSPPLSRCKAPRTSPARQKEASAEPGVCRALSKSCSSMEGTTVYEVAVDGNQEEAGRAPPVSHGEISRTPPLTAGAVHGASSYTTDQQHQSPSAPQPALAMSSHSSPQPEQQLPIPKCSPPFELAENIVEAMTARISPPLIGSLRESLHCDPGRGSFTDQAAGIAVVGGMAPPPPTCKEIPRTSVEMVHYEKVQLSPSKGPSRTPSRMKVPAHPLSVTNSTKLMRKVLCRSSDKETCTPVANSVVPMNKEVIGAVTAEQTGLSGLQYTDEDLAYLERRQNLGRLKDLQVKLDRLTREEKTLAEEKEQLEHAARKVQSDINQMNSSYAKAVYGTRALVDDPLLANLPQAPERIGDNPLLVLREGDLDKLKRLNLQAASQVERLDRKIAERKAELDSKRAARQQLTENRRSEVKQQKELEEQVSDLQAQKTDLEGKVAGLMDRSSSLEVKAKELRLELAQLEKIREAGSTTSYSRERLKKDPLAKKRMKSLIEETLKRLIHRCNLYCRRQQMLQKMGLLKKRQKL